MQKMLELCERLALVVPVGVGDVVERLRLGHAGQLLRHNVLQEWLLSCVITPEESVFLCRSAEAECLPGDVSFTAEVRQMLDSVKDMSGGQVPLGLAETRQRSIPARIPGTREAAYFEPSCGEELRLCLVVSPRDSAHRFHHWQRARKMWWRKFSSSPGRFSLTDVRESQTGHCVHVQASFPWGVHTLETVSLHTNISELEAREGRRKVLPHVVQCVTVVERAVLTFLSDAYDEVEQREVLRLHRKLSPYKVAMAASPGGDVEELGRLATYLGRLLRRAGVCILLLPDVATKSLDSQFARNDALGVPYTAVLNTATLKTGILGLRSRDTSLEEQVHISELKTYVEHIFKNY